MGVYKLLAEISRRLVDKYGEPTTSLRIKVYPVIIIPMKYWGGEWAPMICRDNR